MIFKVYILNFVLMINSTSNRNNDTTRSEKEKKTYLMLVISTVSQKSRD